MALARDLQIQQLELFLELEARTLECQLRIELHLLMRGVGLDLPCLGSGGGEIGAAAGSPGSAGAPGGVKKASTFLCPASFTSSFAEWNRFLALTSPAAIASFCAVMISCSCASCSALLPVPR